MAFRSSTTAIGAGGWSTITATPAGYQAHDVLAAMFSEDVNGWTVTWPTGWEGTDTDVSLNTHDSHTLRWNYKKDASGSSETTFTSSDTTHDGIVTCGAWSGRNNTTPLSTAVVTDQDISGTAPPSGSHNGITASTGDDVGVFFGFDVSAATAGWAASGPSSGFTEREDTQSTTGWCYNTLQTKDSVSAGATGAVSHNAANSGVTADWAGVAFAFAASAGIAPVSGPRLGMWGRDQGYLGSRPGRI